MLTISLLQTPELRVDGEPVSFPFKRANALLYYMAVQRSATRQELIALLWEDCDEATGLKNLRNTLYHIKRGLGGDFLLSPQKSLVVVNGVWETDCDYERFVHKGELAAYRGPFLQGFALKHAFSFEEWMGRTRERLREQYLAALRARAQAAFAAGDTAGSAQLARAYLAEEPYDEELTALLMRCYSAERQYARAAQVYQRLRELLAAELGAEPQESSTVLYYEIMSLWQSASGSAQESAAPAGQEAVYAQLRAALDSFASGAVRRCGYLLSGEAGAGKSRLAEQLRRWAQDAALPCAVYGCTREEAEYPLATWAGVMRPLRELARAEALPLPPPVQLRLRHAFPPPDEREDGERTPRPLDAPLEESVLQFTEALSRRKRLLLLIENIQWMDADSFALLTALLRRAESGRVMAVVSAQEDFLSERGERLRELEGAGLLHRLQLPPLTPEEVRRQLRRELGEEAAAALAETFTRESGGNLTLLAELTQAYRQSGDADAALRLLGNVLAGRLRGLPESAARVAALISLFPEEAPARLLSALMGEDDRALSAGLEELRRRALVEERRAESGAAYRFIHQHMRETVYARMSEYERRPLHAALAQLLAETPPESGRSCREIARQFRLAGETLSALRYEARALALESARAFVPFSPLGGDAPLRLAAEETESAVRRCQLALAEADGRRQSAPEAEGALLLAAGQAALFRGDTQRGEELLGGISALPGRRDAALALQACYLLAVLGVYRQQAERVERYTATGVRLLGREQDTLRSAQFQRLRGCGFCLSKSYDKACYYFLEAIDTLEKLPRSTAVRLQLAAAYGDYGRMCRYRLGYAEACSYFKRALALVQDAAWPGKTWLYVNYGRTVFALEDHMRAREIFESACRGAQESGELWGLAAARAYLAYYCTQDGDYERAGEHLRAAQDAQEKVASPLEGGVLYMASMELRRRMELEQRHDAALTALLPYSAESYARQGVRLLANIPDVFEAELMRAGLCEGIATRQRYRAEELYGKGRHFMTE